MKNWEDERLPLNKEKFLKSLSKGLISKLNKIYKPSSRIDIIYKGNDATFITNENGEPVTLYIGKRKENGDIKGELYNRKIKKRESGMIKESHWDKKGKV